MMDLHTDIVKALETVLPTQYEMFLKSGQDVPCISYMEINNHVEANGDTLGYSRVAYQIKVWANDIADIQKYSVLIDEVLRPLGWKRISSGELYDNQSTMIQKIMTYECLALESFTNGGK